MINGVSEIKKSIVMSQINRELLKDQIVKPVVNNETKSELKFCNPKYFSVVNTYILRP